MSTASVVFKFRSARKIESAVRGKLIKNGFKYTTTFTYLYVDERAYLFYFALAYFVLLLLNSIRSHNDPFSLRRNIIRTMYLHPN